jgi:mRNA interferase MazF
MTPGDIVLFRVADFIGGPPKLRPAVFLSRLPGPYQNLLIAGISTKLHDLEPLWDELLDPQQPDFATSGLHHPSAIRLSYPQAINSSRLEGVIGKIDVSRLQRLRKHLAEHLQR